MHDDQEVDSDDDDDPDANPALGAAQLFPCKSKIRNSI